MEATSKQTGKENEYLAERLKEHYNALKIEISAFFFDRGLSDVVDLLKSLLTRELASVEEAGRSDEAIDTSFVVSEITAFLVRINEMARKIEHDEKKFNLSL